MGRVLLQGASTARERPAMPAGVERECQVTCAESEPCQTQAPLVRSPPTAKFNTLTNTCAAVCGLRLSVGAQGPRPQCSSASSAQTK